LEGCDDPEEHGLIVRVGPLEIDWPKALGYYGGVGLALTCDVIAPPLALFIAAIPVLKLLKAPVLPTLLRIAADVVEGAAKPVGGDADAMVRVRSDQPGVRHLSVRHDRSPKRRAA
jgi:hypothetical protein